MTKPGSSTSRPDPTTAHIRIPRLQVVERPGRDDHPILLQHRPALDERIPIPPGRPHHHRPAADQRGAHAAWHIRCIVKIIACPAPMENHVKFRAWLIAACATLTLQGAITAARADTLDDIKKKGEMVVGMEAAYVPYEFFKDGKIIGYDCDIAQKIADKIGVKVTFIDTDWAGIIPALYAKKFDVIMSGMTMTADRAKKISFSQPYGDASVVILLRANETSIKTAADLSGKTLGTQLGSAPPGRRPSSSRTS